METIKEVVRDEILEEIKKDYLELVTQVCTPTQLVVGLMVNKEQLAPVAKHYGLSHIDLMKKFVTEFFKVGKEGINLAMAKATIDMVIEGQADMTKPYNSTFEKYLVESINNAGIFLVNVLGLGDYIK